MKPACLIHLKTGINRKTAEGIQLRKEDFDFLDTSFFGGIENRYWQNKTRMVLNEWIL